MPSRLTRVAQEEIYTDIINKEDAYNKTTHYSIDRFPTEKSNSGRFEFVRHPTYVKVVWKGAATPGTPQVESTQPAFERSDPVVQMDEHPQVAPSVASASRPPSSLMPPQPPPNRSPQASTPPGARQQEPPLPGRVERSGKGGGGIDRLIIDGMPDTMGELQNALGKPQPRGGRNLARDGIRAPTPPGSRLERDKLVQSNSAPNLPPIPGNQLGLSGEHLYSGRGPPSDVSSPRPVLKVKPSGPQKFRGVGMPKRKNAGANAVPRHLLDQVEIQQLDRHWHEFKPDMSRKPARKHPENWHPMMTPGTR